jgi:hypothetical protein
MTQKCVSRRVGSGVVGWRVASTAFASSDFNIIVLYDRMQENKKRKGAKTEVVDRFLYLG